jgi:hypothetical protein
MKLKQIPSKSFLVKEGSTTKGEVRILPSVLTGGPKQVLISTWSETGRWRREQTVMVDIEVIAAILSESDDNKS